MIHWETGGTTSDGICARNDDAFAAAYVLQDAVGLIVYKVVEDGTLDGLWTIAGKEGNGTEVLTPGQVDSRRPSGSRSSTARCTARASSQRLLHQPRPVSAAGRSAAG